MLTIETNLELFDYLFEGGVHFLMIVGGTCDL